MNIFRFGCLRSGAGCLAGDDVQDLFGEHDDDAARHGEKPVGSLGRVVAFEREADLHHAEPEDDEADGADEAENERRQVVDRSERVAVGVGDS